MSLRNYELLLRYSERSWEHSVVEVRNDAQECTLPTDMTDSFAEFLGVLAGDGHLGSRSYQISVVVSKEVDGPYAVHVQHLFASFGLSVRVTIENNTLKIRINNKTLHSFLSQYHPMEKKKGVLRIPSLSDVTHQRSYLRGLFDTDGSFYCRGHGRAVVNFSSADIQYLRQVAGLLSRLGYHPCIFSKNLFLNRLSELSRFFDEISPANPKHVQKYAAFLQSRQ